MHNTDDIHAPGAPGGAAHTGSAGTTQAAPWQVLVVDDEPMVHSVSRLVLRDMVVDGRPLQLHHAESAAAARRLLAEVPGIAVALVDVVMETDRAGIDLAAHIRHERGDHDMRIVLRTGQPGLAPERQALSEHGVNGYLDKAATDADRLWAAVFGALRAWGELQALRATVESLRRRSITDALTGLYNAGHLAPTLARVLSAAARRGEPVSVLFLDVDDFKLINDERGHRHGDEVLARVGAALIDNSRLEDSCFRYGGDEFLVVLPNCPLAQLEQRYLPRLLQAFADLGLSVSHGASESTPAAPLSADALIQRADARMYERKRAARRPAPPPQPVARAARCLLTTLGD